MPHDIDLCGYGKSGTKYTHAVCDTHSAVTGRPVAAYSENPFGALLSKCIQSKTYCRLAPTADSLKAV